MGSQSNQINNSPIGIFLNNYCLSTQEIAVRGFASHRYFWGFKGVFQIILGFVCIPTYICRLILLKCYIAQYKSKFNRN
jgi:hypothetical protein